jgi:hypothetical protein
MNPTSRPTDREIREAFLRRAAASPSHDLIDRIQQETRAVKQNRPLIALPGIAGSAATARLAWAAVLATLLVALVGVLAFVGSRQPNNLSVAPPSATSSPNATVEPSVSRTSPPPSASPATEPPASAAPSAEPGEPLERGVATVLVDSLRVRSEPGTNPDSERLTPLLDTGQSVYVVDGPIQADGYTWYAVAPRLPDGMLYGELPKGWVAAASRDGEPWLSPITAAPCPSGGLTIEALIALGDRIACFGSGEIQVLASPAVVDVLGGVPCFPAEDNPNCAYEPAWLIEASYAVQPIDGWIGSRPLFWAAGAPGASLAEWDGSEVTFELTGHFDDPAAAQCRIYDTATGEPLVKSAAQTVEDCRQTFVVTTAQPATGD